ncbi:MAG: transporter substrate-binding domain-containing protein [Bacteroidetes bacterium]|nr:transporter substrate-binding domain-containing protein [Bacteroidota bacterium]
MIKKTFTILVFTIFLAIPAYASEKEIFLTSAAYPPYYGDKLENQGFITETIREAFNRVGYDLKVKFYPWKRAEMMAQKGISDGMFPPWHTKEREKWFIFSNPIPPPNTIVFYKRKNKKITFTTYQDLKPYRIGSILGYAYPKKFTEAQLRNNKSYTDKELITKIVQGKIELAIIDQIQADYLLKTNYPEQKDNFEFIEPPLEIKQQHLVISKKTKNAQRIINDFNRGLRIIKEDGTFEIIFKKHGF